MTALIVIVAIAGILGLGYFAIFIYTKSEEHYQVNPFSLGKLAIIASAVVLAVAGVWYGEPDGGYLLGLGLNSTVLLITGGILYLGHTIWLICRTNFFIGIIAPVLVAIFVGSVIVILVLLYMFYGSRRKQEND